MKLVQLPEIDASASHRSNGVDNDGVKYTMETTHTPQTNHGEDLESVNGFNFSIHAVLLSFGNLSVLITFIDLLIVYRKLLKVIARVLKFHKGIEKVENSKFLIENNVDNNKQELLLKIKMFFNWLF